MNPSDARAAARTCDRKAPPLGRLPAWARASHKAGPEKPTTPSPHALLAPGIPTVWGLVGPRAS
eukprot:2679860-Lingulodinium_polyedra.AAC.1